jgi:flagellar secretion chaperone FliS
MTRDGARRYRELAVATASRGQLLLMLHEELLRSIARAAAAIDAGDAPARGTAIVRAQALLTELLVTLDHAVDPELAASLERVYHFAIAELVRADAEASTTRLRSVEGILRTLHDGWRGAVAPA